MTRPKIKTALIGVLLILGVSFAMFAAFAIDRLGAINANVNLLATNSLPTAVSVKDMEVQLGDIRTGYRSHILRSDADGKAAASATIDKAASKLKSDIEGFNKLSPSDEELRLVAEIDRSAATYIETGRKVLSFSAAGNVEQANKILREDMVHVADQAKLAVSHLVEISNADARDAFARANSAYTTTLTITVISTGFIVFIICFAVWFAVSGIAKPVQTITSAMNRLAAGDTNSAIPYAGRTDEIGEMASAVAIFRKNALENLRLEEETAKQRNMTEEQRRQTAEEQRIRAEAMAQATNGLATGLKHLSSGDLTFQLDRPFAADFESLSADFNAAVEQLRGTLGSVSQATSSIDSGSREVSNSADDLSKRTEQQAASLEETAAALDQITVNVTNSSKRAEEARNVAIQANESARQSGAVVANAVQAMGRIEESSGQISNIIGVIDDIAFQTNLLALNAGVEAARAGEAGKGFAVVAQEVRELAQRSAKAAKEIKDLIGKSSIEVGTGVKLVKDTGDALRTIEAHIVTINQHMDSIATSSREQSVGLAEVNTAVNQMDQVTQQNAAMVEEANAAGATLATEAGRLRELISQFQLGQGGQGYTGASQQRAAFRTTASVMAASPHSTPSASPARGMVSKITQAFGGRRSVATVEAQDNWEEF